MKLSLEKLKQETPILARQIDFTAEMNRYSFSDEFRGYLLERTGYYTHLAAMVKLLEAKKVIEVGTFSGAGSVALAKHAEHVTTCDITFDNVHDQSIFGEKIERRLLSSAEECIDLDYQNYDFVFIDIDHLGATEFKIHKHLSRSYRGYAAYDDIYLGDGMQAFWSAIENPKLGTRWHHSGLGVVEY